MQSVLLLNNSYMPYKVISWKDAFDLWFREKAEIVEEYSDIIINTVNKAYNCPAVMRLLKYRKFNKKAKAVKFNRLNVYHRDNFRCCYCGCQPGVSQLTKDHVIPRSRPGGSTTWENIVTACLTCNLKKADKTPKEAGMPMKFEAYKPSFSNFRKFKHGLSNVPSEWRDWLFY